MAKRKQSAKQPTNTGHNAASTEALARRALCCITGCGALTAIDRIAAMDSVTVQQIADYEQAGQRHKVVALLQSLASSTTTTEATTLNADAIHPTSEGADEAADH